MPTQKRLSYFFLQLALLLIFFFLTYFFGMAIFAINTDYMELFLVFLAGLIIFIPIEVLYLLRILKSGRSIRLPNKLIEIFCYFFIVLLAAPLLYMVWSEIKYDVLFGRFFGGIYYTIKSYLFGHIEIDPVYPALIFILLGIILTNKKLALMKN